MHILSTLTNEGWTYIYVDYNIRDFEKLLKSLDIQLWHLTCKQEKANKKQKLNSK